MGASEHQQAVRIVLKALKALFESQFAAGPAAHAHALELAAAALLIEVTRADQQDHPAEETAVVEALRRTARFSAEELAALVARAGDAVTDAVSLHEFTTVLNERLDLRGKCLLLEDLWRVAYADGRIDKYEDYTIRKIADLLYVAHSEFILAKHRAARSAAAPP